MALIIITNQGLRYVRKLKGKESNGYSDLEIKFLREVSDQKIHKEENIKIPNRPQVIKKLAEKRDIVIFE